MMRTGIVGASLLISLSALTSCAPRPPLLAAQTPTMVSVCSAPEGSLSAAVNLAETSCQMYGKHATLISTQVCGFSTWDISNGRLNNFRCE